MTKNLVQVHQVFQLILNSVVEKEQMCLPTFSTILIRKVIIQGPPCRGRGFSPPPPNFEHHFSPPGSPLHSIVSIFIWPQAYQSICIATKVLTYISTKSQPSSRLSHFSNSFSAGQRPAKAYCN